MDFSLIANSADLVAAFGVIASLIFLAVQVRRNTNEVRNSHLQSSQALFASFRSTTLDLRVAEVIEKGKQSFHELSQVEKMVFTSWMHEFMIVSDNFVRLGRDGFLAPGMAEYAEKRIR